MKPLSQQVASQQHIIGGPSDPCFPFRPPEKPDPCLIGPDSPVAQKKTEQQHPDPCLIGPDSPMAQEPKKPEPCLIGPYAPTQIKQAVDRSQASQQLVSIQAAQMKK